MTNTPRSSEWIRAIVSSVSTIISAYHHHPISFKDLLSLITWKYHLKQFIKYTLPEEGKKVNKMTEKYEKVKKNNTAKMGWNNQEHPFIVAHDGQR